MGLVRWILSMPFNSKGMFRGFATADGKEGVFIYRDETASK